MPEHESVRSTAEAIGRITCIKTGEEIGLLYQWDNGDLQPCLSDDSYHRIQISITQKEESDTSQFAARGDV
ncbi:hypothetical protein [Sulfitobacter sp. R86518]|uniref:hypothetical protein n=1 Tax=Sulfitobacter sp. R86518 TaxID=3093858 RepID=UPI0036DC7D8A